MFWIGNGNYNSYVRKDMVTAISDYAIAENKRKCKEAKEKYLLSDYSCGGKRKALYFFLMEKFLLVLSPLKNLSKFGMMKVNQRKCEWSGQHITKK